MTKSVPLYYVERFVWGVDMEDGVEGDIKKLIDERGRITFARFMEMALFSPRGGYYTSEEHR